MDTLKIILCLLGFIGGVTFIFILVRSIKQWGKEQEERDEFERQLQSGNIRIKIDDTLSKLDDNSKRVLLSEWVSGISANKTDKG